MGLIFFINNGAGERTLVSLGIFHADRMIFIFAPVKNESEDLVVPGQAQFLGTLPRIVPRFALSLGDACSSTHDLTQRIFAPRPSFHRLRSRSSKRRLSFVPWFTSSKLVTRKSRPEEESGYKWTKCDHGQNVIISKYF